jgi:phosphocarrier protein HPr
VPAAGPLIRSPPATNEQKRRHTCIASTLTKELIVQNKMGIHARPAAMIVRITNKFKAEVFVEKEEEQVNGKSIMGLDDAGRRPGLESEVHRDRRRCRPMLGELEALFRQEIRRGLSQGESRKR